MSISTTPESIDPREVQPKLLLPLNGATYLNGSEFIDPVCYGMAKMIADYINQIFADAGYYDSLVASFYGHNYQGDISLGNYPILRVYRKSDALASFSANYKVSIFVISYAVMFAREKAVSYFLTYINDVIYSLLINTLRRSPLLPILPATLDNASTIEQDVTTNYFTDTSDKMLKYYVNIEAKMKNVYGDFR